MARVKILLVPMGDGGKWAPDDHAKITPDSSPQGISVPQYRNFNTKSDPLANFATRSFINEVKNGNYSKAAKVVGLKAFSIAEPLLLKTPIVGDKIRNYAANAMYNSEGDSNPDKINIYNNDKINKDWIQHRDQPNHLNDSVDLVKTYLRGSGYGLESSNNKPYGLQKYNDKYGEIANYKLPVSIDNDTYINLLRNKLNVKDNNELKKVIDNNIKQNGVFSIPQQQDVVSRLGYESPLDIGGHMNYINKDSSGNYNLRVQDIWKFTPEDYRKKWLLNNEDISHEEAIKPSYQNYLKYMEPELLDKAGHPFTLTSDNIPIKLQQGGQVMKQKVRIVGVPEMKYGGNRPGSYNQLDTGWNTGTYAGAPGVMPDPNPYSRTGRTLEEVPEEHAGGPNVINAEKDEQVLGQFTADGLPSLMSVDGPPHTQGGKNVAVPNNSFVFSDTQALKIKNPEVLKLFNETKGKTPAGIAKKYDLSRYTKIIADPNTDSVSKKTAQMMVDNYTSKLNLLANVQEAHKSRMGIGKDNQQMFQMGGTYNVHPDHANMLKSQGYEFEVIN